MPQRPGARMLPNSGTPSCLAGTGRSVVPERVGFGTQQFPVSTRPHVRATRLPLSQQAVLQADERADPLHIGSAQRSRGRKADRDREAGIAVFDGERSALESVAARESEAVVVDPSVVAALVTVFGTWTELDRDQKRAILKDFRIRVSVTRGARRGPLDVADLTLGVVRDDFRIPVPTKA